MILDNENQRRLMLNAINVCNWPGQVVEEIVKLKIAIASAPISEELVKLMKED